MKNLSNIAILAVIALFASDAFARSERVGQVPNGNQNSCGTCHAGGAGGAPRNPFGIDVEANLSEVGAAGVVDWASIFALDSDGDGFTNGEELGDSAGGFPDGVVTYSSDPADPNSTPCGDGVVNFAEVCDGGDLDGATCESLGEMVGTLGCVAACDNYDTTGCDGNPANNANNANNENNANNANNANNVNNANNTNGNTNGDDNNGDDDSGCATADPSSHLFPFLFIAFVALRRRRI